MKITHIIGARPQFIKASIVTRAIKEHRLVSNKSINEIVVHTGQHYDQMMSGIFLDDFNIHVDINLEIKEYLQGKMTARMLTGIEKVLLDKKPDIVIVYGDTNSTLAGALSSAKLQIPIAHVEAGLRSYNMKMPEEINRIVTDRLSTWLLCPTQSAVNNLEKEGMVNSKKGVNQHVVHVRDVMFDAFLLFKELSMPQKQTIEIIDSFNGNYYLTTVHRGENTDVPENLFSIISALDEIACETPIIWPIHPRTLKQIDKFNIPIHHIKLIPPVGYFDMLALLKGCKAVFTDSGGLQKESFFMKKKCIVLREETEWIELIEEGYNFLAGADKQKILSFQSNIDSSNKNWNRSFFGDGHAGKKIIYSIMTQTT